MVWKIVGRFFSIWITQRVRCPAKKVMLQIPLLKDIPRLIFMDLWSFSAYAYLLIGRTLPALTSNSILNFRVIMKQEEDQDFYVEGVEFVAWSILGNLLLTIQSGNELLREKISLAGSIIHVLAKQLVESSVLVYKMGLVARSTVGERLFSS